jgi:hypothetical protein
MLETPCLLVVVWLSLLLRFCTHFIQVVGTLFQMLPLGFLPSSVFANAML